MAAANAALGRMDSPMRTARAGARELATGIRQLGAEAIGATGPFGRIISGFMELGGSTVLYAAAGVGLIALAIRELNRPFAEADKALEDLNKRFREGHDVASQYQEVLNKFRAERVAQQAAIVQAGASAGGATSMGQGAALALGELAARALAAATATRDLREQVKIMTAEYMAVKAVSDQYLGTLNGQIATFGMSAKMAAAYQAALHGVRMEDQGAAADAILRIQAQAKWQANQKQTIEVVQSMNVLAATIGLSDYRAKAYAVSVSDLTDKQKAAQIAAYELAAAVTENYQAYTNAVRESERYNEQLHRGEQSVAKGIDDLLIQADTFGKSAEEVAIYRLELQAAALDNDALSQTYLNQIEAISKVLAAERQLQRFVDAQRRAEEQAEREREQIRKNMIRNTQDALAEFMTGLLTTGNAFEDFCKRILKLWMDLAAQIAAQQILKWILGLSGGGTPGGGGGEGPVTGRGGGSMSPSLVSAAARGSITGAQAMIVHQTINFQVSALDQRGVAGVLQAQKDTIAAVVVKAARESANFRAALARG